MIERQDDDGVVTLRLAHGKASALDAELLEAIERSLDEVARSDARAVVLTGTGSIFSAGVDLFRLLEEGAPYVALLPSPGERDPQAVPLPTARGGGGERTCHRRRLRPGPGVRLSNHGGREGTHRHA